MKKSEVLSFFNNRASDVAKACNVSAAAVAQWGKIIPEKNALKLEKLTNGKLVYKADLYAKRLAA